MTGYRAMATSLAAIGLVATGCGGGERQDAGEKAATYTVDVTQASFPAEQRIARQQQMRIAVKNTGDRALPDVAVTVDSFTRRSEQAGQADPARPVWIIDEGPAGGETAYVNTWALAGLEPGQTKTFRWKVTPIEAGRYKLRYTVAAGLTGNAKARDAQGGSSVAGTFAVRIDNRPGSSRVNPDTGDVIRDAQ